MRFSKLIANNPIYELSQTIGYHLSQMRWVLAQSSNSLTGDETQSLNNELRRFEKDVKGHMDDIIMEHRHELSKTHLFENIATAVFSGIICAFVTYAIIKTNG